MDDRDGSRESDSHLARFREEVFLRGTFTHDWFTDRVHNWEPTLRTLEARGARILEIGSYEGLSACYLLWRLPDATITCLDMFTVAAALWSAPEPREDLEAVFDGNLALVGSSRCRKLVGDSRRLLLDLLAEDARFELVYVDGSYQGLDVMVDASLAWQLLEAGGTLVFDDYSYRELGQDALLRPGPAIDVFLNLVEGKYHVLFKDHQIAVRKQPADRPTA